MAHKITEDCIACGSCIDQCPESCIAEGDPKYVIDEGSCIDCAACEAVCPSGAIKEA